MSVKELDEDELENLEYRLNEEKKKREFTNINDKDLEKMHQEVKIELSKRKKEGRINSDPVVEL